jgi:signal transduction histidine kinase
VEPAVHPRWLVLFAMTRAVAVVIAVSLLIAHRVTPYDALLGWVTLCYGVLTLLAAVHRPRLFRHPAAWVVDLTIALGLILASGDWRSPFYLLALTALAPPTTTLGFRPALGVGLAFTVAFFVVAVLTGLDMDSLRSTIRLETLATHLALPGVVTLGLAYAAEVLRRLERERGRSERLAVEAERRRIAWDLHDSAKQRLHAAHLVFSSLEPSETVELGLAQLRGRPPTWRRASPSSCPPSATAASRRRSASVPTTSPRAPAGRRSP